MRASVPTEDLRIITDLDSTPAGMATPYSVQAFDEVTSTQDLAASMAYRGPVLVVAGRQMVGRGRSGSQWLNADRAMAASLGFTPDWPRPDWTLIPLVAGLAAAEVVGGSCSIKWPNDLMINSAKVGGILTEVSGDILVTGCGLNLHWTSSPPGMTAVYAIDPGPERPLELARLWADTLLRRLAGGPAHWGLDEYREKSATIGQLISWEPEGQGRALDVAADGSLLVTTADGDISLTAGAVRHIRVEGPPG
jgi:BirA family biotin operon repressor/biotin-[acetyl-CoA-carboxylase] ligase